MAELLPITTITTDARDVVRRLKEAFNAQSLQISAESELNGIQQFTVENPASGKSEDITVVDYYYLARNDFLTGHVIKAGNLQKSSDLEEVMNQPFLKTYFPPVDGFETPSYALLTPAFMATMPDMAQHRFNVRMQGEFVDNTARFAQDVVTRLKM